MEHTTNLPHLKSARFVSCPGPELTTKERMAATLAWHRAATIQFQFEQHPFQLASVSAHIPKSCAWPERRLQLLGQVGPGRLNLVLILFAAPNCLRT